MASRKPPWWAYFEPPRWFPGWLHLLTCTHCRNISAWLDSPDGRRWNAGGDLSRDS